MVCLQNHFFRHLRAPQHHIDVLSTGGVSVAKSAAGMFPPIPVFLRRLRDRPSAKFDAVSGRCYFGMICFGHLFIVAAQDIIIYGLHDTMFGIVTP